MYIVSGDTYMCYVCTLFTAKHAGHFPPRLSRAHHLVSLQPTAPCSPCSANTAPSAAPVRLQSAQQVPRCCSRRGPMRAQRLRPWRSQMVRWLQATRDDSQPGRGAAGSASDDALAGFGSRSAEGVPRAQILWPGRLPSAKLFRLAALPPAHHRRHEHGGRLHGRARREQGAAHRAQDARQLTRQGSEAWREEARQGCKNGAPEGGARGQAAKGRPPWQGAGGDEPWLGRDRQDAEDQGGAPAGEGQAHLLRGEAAALRG